MPHLLLAVTAHGYGHLAQSSPVVEALTRRLPGLRVTLLSDVDPAFAGQRLPPGFHHLRQRSDPGLRMRGPMLTDWDGSLTDYLRFDAEYGERLRRQIDLLRRLAPDLVLADVPWLPLDAARRLGIPAVGLCSLTWYDILRECPLGDRVPEPVLARMREVYAAADLFIRPAPTMPMTWVPNAVDVGPIARQRPNRADELRRRLGVAPGRALVLVQFGGFDGFDPLRNWPEQGRVHFLLPGPGGHDRRDASSLAEHGLGMLDCLGSADLWITKPGYGTYAEAACNGIPVLYCPRGDWPEEPYLNRWLADHVPLAEVPLGDLLAGRIGACLEPLLSAPRPRPVAPTGIEGSVEHLVKLLGVG